MRNINNIVHDTALRLKEIRETKGVSQSEFAKSLGVSLRSYQYYENGTRPLPIDVLRRLAETGMKIQWLLTGKGERDVPAQEQVEQLKAMVEYWKANYMLAEAGIKLARTQVKEKYGEDSAAQIFDELMPSPQVEVMFPHPAGKVHDAGAVAEEEKKQEKGKRSKS